MDNFVNHVARNKIQFPSESLRRKYFEAWLIQPKIKLDLKRCDGCGNRTQPIHDIEVGDGTKGFCDPCKDFYFEAISEEPL